MANRRKRMNQIKEVIRLHECKFSTRKIARLVKMSRPTIQDYLNQSQALGWTYASIKDQPDSTLLKLLQPKQKKPDQRLQPLQALFPEFVLELKKTGVTKQLLWEEYCVQHEAGYQYSQFCYHFQHWLKKNRLSMHLEHKAGDKMYIDFAGDKWTIYDARTDMPKTEASIFVAILPASYYPYAEAMASEKKIDWINGTQNALYFFGGSPTAVVPDRTKCAVTDGDKFVPLINQDFEAFAEYFDMVVLPTRKHSPKDKALVEDLVKQTYRRIMAPLRNKKFYSLEEVNTAIQEMLHKLINRYSKHFRATRQELFDRIEKPCLKQLPAERYEMKYYQPGSSHINYHVLLKEDDHYYSIPYDYRNHKNLLIYTEKTVEIYQDNIRIAVHSRVRGTNKYTTTPEHMPSHHRIVAEWSPEKFIDWGTKRGLQVKNMAELMLNTVKHPEQAFKQCMGMLALGNKYGNMRLNRACGRALSYEAYSYRVIKNILEKGLDQEDETIVPESVPVIEDENFRNSEYFQ